MKNSEKRLKILSDEEIEGIYSRPRFTKEERGQYFALSPAEKAAMEEFHSIKSRSCFVLQLGYFKACRLFFPLDIQETEEDAAYVQNRYFPEFDLQDLHITKVTRLKQQGLILGLSGYRYCNAPERRRLEEKAQKAVKVCGKPLYIFRELMRFLEEEHIVAPGYSSLQNTAGRALTFEQKRLADILRRHIAPAEKASLRRLLEGTDGLYEITKLKRDPRDFTYGEIQREIGRGEQIGDLYRLAHRLLPELDISNESIRYYPHSWRIIPSTS